MMRADLPVVNVVPEGALRPGLRRIARMLQLRIEPIRAMTSGSSEAGQLVWLSDRLAALIVEAEGGWYLHSGLGPFEGEGVLFPTIAAIEGWIRERLISRGTGD